MDNFKTVILIGCGALCKYIKKVRESESEKWGFIQIVEKPDLTKLNGMEYSMVIIDEGVQMHSDCKEMTESEMKDKERAMFDEQRRDTAETFDRRLVYNQIIKNKKRINTKSNLKTKFIRRKI